jgi:methylmalonyl-CoA mutase, N-terminal domain
MNIFKPSGTFATSAGAAGKDVAEECARWQREAFAPARGDAPDRKKFVTDTGIPIEPLYTPAHLDNVGFDYLRDLGFPGEYPFTRGDRAVVPTEFDMSGSKS